MFGGVYTGTRVLVTGHTGFKGSWLTLWLHELGAECCGYALPPPDGPNHWSLLRLPVRSESGDVRDAGRLERLFAEFRPELVFHLAAQPLVRRSYREPAETFAVNVQGTVNVLEACRRCGTVRAAVAITSDKCYENREQDAPYVETDPMGGFDPYSASKGCAELVAASYRRAFFAGAGRPLLATARAGNVIGGGDWAEDRLVPDLMRAAAAGRVEAIRSPDAVRPWQHVLEPLSGYLLLGERLLRGDAGCAEAWNFGPDADGARPVAEVAAGLAACWPEVRFRADPPADAPHEAKLLKLDCAKAARRLRWHGVWTPRETWSRTAEWYRSYYRGDRIVSREQLNAYRRDAAAKDLPWTSNNEPNN